MDAVGGEVFARVIEGGAAQATAFAEATRSRVEAMPIPFEQGLVPA